MLNVFEENALIYLLQNTKGVKFLTTVNTDFYEIVIGRTVCKSISKDELFNIFMKLYGVN